MQYNCIHSLLLAKGYKNLKNTFDFSKKNSKNFSTEKQN
jgi:hypothetical protein